MDAVQLDTKSEAR